MEVILTTKASESLKQEVEKDLEKEDVAMATILDKEACGKQRKSSGQT